VKLLVLGGGFTGRAVARRAIARGIDVAATTRSEERAASLRALGVAPLVFALDAARVAARVDGDTGVVVTIPPDGVTDAAIAGAASRARAIVYVSSTAVFGDASGPIDERTPTSRAAPRAAPRLDAEDAWRRAGASIVRAPAIYGPGRGLHLRLARGEVRAVATGPNAISRVHVDDLAAALLALVTRAGRAASASFEPPARGAVYVAGDAEPAPNIDVVRFLCGALAIPVPPPAPLDAVDDTLRHDRRIDASRLRADLGLALAYPSYREGYAHCIAEDRGALAAAGARPGG